MSFLSLTHLQMGCWAPLCTYVFSHTVLLCRRCKCGLVTAVCLCFSLCICRLKFNRHSVVHISADVHFVCSANTLDARTLYFEVIPFLIFSWNFVVRSLVLQVLITSNGLKEEFLVYNGPKSTSVDYLFGCLKYKKYKNCNAVLLRQILLILI